MGPVDVYTSAEQAGHAAPRVALPAEDVPAFCRFSRNLASAATASEADLRRAALVLRELLRRGITVVPFGIVLDWTMLVALEWDFPFRSLHAHPQDLPDGFELPRDYERDGLNPYLVGPTLRPLRAVFGRCEKSVERMAQLLELIFSDAHRHVPVVLSHYHVEPDDLAVATDAPARAEAARPWPPHRLAHALHAALAEYLRQRLRPAGSDVAAQGAVARLEPSDVDVYELEHVELFASRAARLHVRRLGEVALALGPPDLGRLIRAAATPDVAIETDDDTRYPAGGVAELTTAGSFENLVPSELMYLDDDPHDPVDLFSLKFVESELLYYLRDAGLFVQRRRRVHVVVWDVPRFRLKLPRQTWPLDQMLDGTLLQLTRDLLNAYDGTGVHVTLHWCGAPAAESADLFDLLFRAEQQRQVVAFQSHADAEALAQAVDQLDAPHATWLVVMPPSDDEAARHDAVESLRHVRPGGLRGYGRPVYVLHWDVGAAAADGSSAKRLGPLAQADYPEMTFAPTRADEPLREVRFAVPSEAAAAIGALRSFRLFALNLFLGS